MIYSKETIYELTRNQLAAHIDYDVACEIADSRLEENKERELTAINNEVPIEERERVHRIIGRIEEIQNGHPQA
jgi:hypothetical protein